MGAPERPLRVFSTCPGAGGESGPAYLDRVADVARWSERAGCAGILIYSDHGQLDPWLVAQLIIDRTSTLAPLVAVQPAYMHPYAAAKAVASLGHLYGRRVYLNMTAGGFTNDLQALDDPTPHDRRYARLVEYTAIVKRLVTATRPVEFAGEFYRIRRPNFRPPLPDGLEPGVFVSGSSAAGLEAARELGATAIRYPEPAGLEPPVGAADADFGIRVGIITRESEDRAWAVARTRFPEDRAGQITHQLAMKVSDSAWHRALSARDAEAAGSPYWLVPFRNYKSMCPYLVGSHDRVAEELSRYMALGYGTLILDAPPSEEDLDHTSAAIARAAEVLAQ